MPKHGPPGDPHGLKSGKRSSGGRAAAKDAARKRLTARRSPQVGVGTPQGSPANLASPQVQSQNFLQFLQQLFGGNQQSNAPAPPPPPPGVGFGLGAARPGPSENDPLGIGSVGAGDLANLFTTMGILRNQNVNTTAQAFDQDPVRTLGIVGKEFMRAILNEGEKAFTDIKFPLGGPKP